MNWNQIENWKQEKKQIFTVGKDVVGWLKQYQKFTFVNVYKAGNIYNRYIL